MDNASKPSNVPVTISISLSEIYKVLCNNCRDKLLRLLAERAQVASITDALRKQLEGGE